jgi:glyceraldehyde 3-phosphate dehydrogenase
MKTIKKIKPRVAINGFGRIGRHAMKIGHKRWNIVAVNDQPLPLATFAHLLKYDSLMGEFDADVSFKENDLIVNRKRIPFFSEANPENLPWKKLKVDVVIEAVGLFTNFKDANKHIAAGAKKVIITAPAKGEDLTVLMGINQRDYKPAKHNVLSAGSCTANCLAPVLEILDKGFGIKRAYMTTCHCYTQNQKLVDSPHKDLRRSRMAGINMIPTVTTAMEPVLKVLPKYRNKLSGIAIRVPIPNVSLIELIFEMKKDATPQAINARMQKAAERNPYLQYTEIPFVSSDFMQNPSSGIVAGDLTDVVDKRMGHVIAWYNNEWGYSNRVADLVDYVAGYL